MKFKNRLVASCQDMTEWTAAMALKGGAGGLRVNGLDQLEMALSLSKGAVPVIACWKKDLPGTPTRITPHIELAISLAKNGANYVAFDATNRRRFHSVKEMVRGIHDHGACAVADVSSVSEGLAAHECGADYVATTLFHEPDVEAVREMAGLGIKVMAEGNIRTPYQACLMKEAGAELVCVGSAISRPHHVTKWFVEVLGD